MPQSREHAPAKVVALPIRHHRIVVTPADQAVARATLELWRGWTNLALATQFYVATACFWPILWLKHDAASRPASRAINSARQSAEFANSKHATPN